MKTEREKLIRDVKRCFADLLGGHVWTWDIGRVRLEAKYILRERRSELASDEVRKLEVLAAEFPAFSRRQSNENPG